MAVTNIDAAYGTSNSQWEVNVAVPTNAAGDLLVAVIATDNYTPSSIPAGWTDPRGDKILFYKISNGSEPGTYRWAQANSGFIQNWATGITSYRGISNDSSYAAYQGSAGNSGGTGPASFTSYSHIRDGALQVCPVWIRADNITGFGAAPAGYTMRMSAATSGVGMVMLEKLASSMGETLPGNVTWTNSGFDNAWTAISAGFNRKMSRQSVL